jgi:hypothetical protein
MTARWKEYTALLALLAGLLPVTTVVPAGAGIVQPDCCRRDDGCKPCCSADTLQPVDCCSAAPPATTPSQLPPPVTMRAMSSPTWVVVALPSRPTQMPESPSRPPDGGILVLPLFTLHSALLT